MRLIDILANHKTIAPIVTRIRNSDIGSRMARGAFWSIAGTSVAKIIVLIAGMFCARILGKTGYGEFGMVRSTVSMLVVFGALGLGMTASKYIAEFREHNPYRISSIYTLTGIFSLISGLIMATVIIAFAPQLADKMLQAPYLSNDIKLGGILLFVTILNSAQNGVLAGLEDFRSIALNTLIASIAEALLMLIGAYYYGVSGAILGFGAGFVVLYLSNLISIRKNMHVLGLKGGLRYINKEDIKILYKFSIPAALSSILVAPVFWYIRSMLVRTFGFGEVAIFDVADQWKIMILFIPGALSQIVMPILSSLYAKTGNNQTYKKALRYNIILNVAITTILAVAISLLSNFIIKLYGSGFGNVWPLIILAFSTIFSSIASVIGTAIASKGRMWVGFGFNFFWATLVVSLSYLLLSFGLGASGLAMAVLSAYIIHTILQCIYLVWSDRKDIIKKTRANAV